MKTLLLALALVFFSNISVASESSTASAEATSDLSWESKARGLGLGFQISSLGNQFAMGLQAKSPTFFWNMIRVNVQGDLAYAGKNWQPYGVARVAIETGFVLPGLPIRSYTGGGPLVLVTANSMASSLMHVGGFGYTGLEFFLRRQSTMAVFVELGGMGTGVFADRLDDNPLLANGFTMSWGYRGYL